MSTLKHVTLVIRPSLAFPTRWSVDYRSNDSPATYQASFVTHPSRESAIQAAQAIRSNLEVTGITIEVLQEESNSSALTARKSNESEEKIKKRLESYLDHLFEPIRKLSLREFFDMSNWPKGLKAAATKSPHLLSLVILATLFFPQPLDGLLAWILPKDFPLGSSQILTIGPLLIGLTTLVVYYERARVANRADKVREWILQLTVEFGWDRDQFGGLLLSELQQIDYASFTHMIEGWNERDQNSLTKLADKLSIQLEGSDERKIDVLTNQLIDGDFARKIQALASVAAEGDYKPKHLAIFPFLLIVSLNSVRATMQGLLQGESTTAIESVHQFHEGMVYMGFLLGAVLSLVVFLPGLIWTLVLSWSVSVGLFLINLLASLFTVWILVLRPLGTIGNKRGIPRGLGMHECAGALNVA